MKQQLKFKISDDGYLLVSYDNGCTWENLGMVRGNASVVPGPRGPQGPSGADGADGEDGADGQTPYVNATTGTWWVGNTDTGLSPLGENAELEIERSEDIGEEGTPSVSSRTVGNKTYVQFHYLKGEKGDDGAAGEKGEQGGKGDKGDPGDGMHFKDGRDNCTDLNDAYVDSTGDLYVRTSEAGEAAQFLNLGNLKGPQGTQGPQGPQGHPIYFTSSGTYDSDLDRPIFNIVGANAGDYLIYIGNNATIAPAGQLFQLSDTLDAYDRQVWIDQNFNIKGPKGDTLNAADIIPAFRLVENPSEGSSQLQVSFDNITWVGIGNLPSKGIVNVRETDFSTALRRVFRIAYTDGTYYDMVFDFTAAVNEAGVVIEYVESMALSTDSERDICSITQLFFNSTYLLNDSIEEYNGVNYIPFYDSTLAQRLISGEIKKATIKAAIDGDMNTTTIYMPASVCVAEEEEEECLLLGWGIQCTEYVMKTAKISGVAKTSKNLRGSGPNSGSDFYGLGPALYAISIRKHQNRYEYAGFMIKTYSNTGIWGAYT